MKRKLLIRGSTTLAVFLFGLAAAQFSAAEVPANPRKNALRAHDALSQQIAPIKSRADLERYLKMVPRQSNALYLLSAAARERFIESITFNEKGVTGFSFADLQRELPQEQIAKILALFGSESSATYIKPTAKRWQQKGGDSNLCGGVDNVLVPGYCEDPLDGGIPDAPGGGGGGWGGPSTAPKFPNPLPPPDPIPGQMAPVQLANGDYYHMYCSLGGSTCDPKNNSICKAKC
ncbi:MAG TPA: hypothetical protein VF800_01450 [Telluria sp.]|jgi:hypothetical protein